MQLVHLLEKLCRSSSCRKVAAAIFVLFAGIGFPASGFASEKSPVRYHTLVYHLEPGEQSRQWTAVFDLPEDALRQGEVFTCRRVFTSGDLEIISESLIRNRYSICLLLARSFESSGRGNLYLQLEAGVPIQAAPLPAPVDLSLASSPWPMTIQVHQIGTHLAAAVFDCSNGEVCWERVFSPNSIPLIDPAALSIGRRYLLKVSQSDETARSSEAMCLVFRLAARSETCLRCNGTGHKAERATDRERAEPCPTCRGAGARFFPFPVVEAVCPDTPDALAGSGSSESCQADGRMSFVTHPE